MDGYEVVITGLFIIAIAIVFLNQGDGGSAVPPPKSRINNLIQDKDVTVDSVLANMSGLKLGKKGSFSEKDVHDELEEYLKKIFYSVTREHAIEGKNIKRIDFDIGNGKVGIEIKLADSILKEGENDRLIGQIHKYATRKYTANNLIIALAGYSHHERNTIVHELIGDIERAGCHFVFIKAGK